MSQPEPGELYWRIVEPVWAKIDIYSGPEYFLHTFSAQGEVARTLFAVHFCQSEVRNGGFHQFFSNPTGVLAPEAADGFVKIGLPQLGHLVKRAMAFFGDDFPRDQEERIRRLEAVPGDTREEWDPFYDIDDTFYSVLREHPFEVAADDYAREASRGLEPE